MARTRASKGTASAKASQSPAKTESTTTVTYALAPECEKPPRLFIIPKNASPAARIVTLQNPRYAKPARYLYCPEAGFFEFTKIAATKSSPRSWLLENTRTENAAAGKDGLESQVTKSAELYVATPIDPLFLLLPALVASQGCKSAAEVKAPKKRMFLSSDDHFDALTDPNIHLTEVLNWPGARPLLEARIGAVCDTVDAGDEKMFRLNESKLLSEVLSKARRMSDQGLPRSMDDKFVAKALEAPILGIRSQAAPSKPSSGSSTPLTDSADSQSTVSSVETSATSVSDASTATTSVSDDSAANEVVTNAITASEEVTRLQRLRIAFNFICSSYITPSLAETLKSILAAADTKETKVDFKPLDDYLAQLTKLRKDAAAARSSDYGRKRAHEEEDYERTEKRRKQEEEDKIKKANQSKGVKQLAKVNTSGMKKLSEFFKKK